MRTIEIGRIVINPYYGVCPVFQSQRNLTQHSAHARKRNTPSLWPPENAPITRA